jgi:HEAT repeat-containing protein 5
MKQTTLTAAYCAKTLITASLIPTANPVLRHCAGLLIPSMITLVSGVAACINDQTQMTSLLPALDEALKAFTTFFAGVPDNSRTPP